MEKFYYGTRRVASYNYKDSYRKYLASKTYKKDLSDYKKAQQDNE